MAKRNLENTDLLKHLSMLSDNDRRFFLKCVQAQTLGPISRQKQVQTLLEHLVLNWQNLPEEKETLWKQLFENALNEPVLDNIFSESLKLLKSFIIVNNSELSDELQNHLCLYKFYRKVDAHEEAAKMLLKIKKIANNNRTEIPSHSQLLQTYQIEYLLFENSIQRFTSVENLNLRNVAHSLEAYYTLEKLRLHLAAISPLSYLAIDFQNLGDGVAELLEKANDFDSPIIKAYALACQLCINDQSDSDIYFFQLREWLYLHEDNLNLEDLRDLLTISRNYCTQKYNAGHSNYSAVLFESMIKDLKYIRDFDGRTKQTTLLNIAIMGIKLNRLDEVDVIITESLQLGLIGADQPEQIAQFFKGLIAFYKADYDHPALCFATMAKFNDLNYQLTWRRLELKALYERKILDNTNIEAFEKFIRRMNDITASVKQRQLSFCKLLKLLNFEAQTSKSGSKKVLNIIESETTADREWFLQKVAKLKKSVQ